MQRNALLALALIGTLAVGYLIYSHQPKTHDVQPDHLKDIYNKWKAEYNIHVGAAEDQYRFKVFAANYAKIMEHNSVPGRTYQLGLNAFSHLTQEEFAATHLGLSQSSNTNKNFAALPVDNLQSKVDWRPKLNKAKDQGHCGSCWAFSAVGAIEGLHSAVKGELFDLSEQELVDCSRPYGNNGCSGGLMDQAFRYAITNRGLASQKDYPYTAVDGACKGGLPRSAPVADFKDVPTGSADALKAALAQQPVAVAIEADTVAFQMYKGGVMNDASCGTQLDHGVVAVGYNTEDSTPYYIVRNSWGANWGEEGHIRIGIQDGDGICGIHKMASFPTA